MDTATPTTTAEVISTSAELLARQGEELGSAPTPWMPITQAMVNAFAAVTGDHQWIHVDVPRAKELLGGTIVHGYLLESLLPALFQQKVDFSRFASVLNQGSNRVRFISMVPVGMSVRLGPVEVVEVNEVDGGAKAILRLTLEVEGQDTPACVAEVVYRFQD